ncbi:MAG: signal peptidase I [Pseudomonadota bacterium]
MDIDFPFVLTWVVLGSGAIWAFDALLLRPRRMAAASALEGSASDAAVEAAAAEPVVVEWARSFFPVLLLVLRSFVAEPYQIPTPSMVPTLDVGDFVLVNKWAYGLRLPVLGTKVVPIGEPQRGDIMVFVPPHSPKYFIKRVIGVPGDRIRYENKGLWINGERIPQEFVKEFRLDLGQRGIVAAREYRQTINEIDHSVHLLRGLPPKRAREWVLEEGEYFMMGDNRDRSDDSRSWGPANEANIVGKAVAVWMHKEPGWHLPTFSQNRWLNGDQEAQAQE